MLRKKVVGFHNLGVRGSLPPPLYRRGNTSFACQRGLGRHASSMHHRISSPVFCLDRSPWPQARSLVRGLRFAADQGGAEPLAAGAAIGSAGIETLLTAWQCAQAYGRPVRNPSGEAMMLGLQIKAFSLLLVVLLIVDAAAFQ